MNTKLISICIPTWNDADKLNDTLVSIIPKALEFKNEVEICISNNGSSDHTHELVMQIKEKYSELEIKYNKNPSNLGFAKNLVKAVTLAEGRFVWLFGDDKIAKNSLKDILSCVKKFNHEKIGLIVVGRESHCYNNSQKLYNTIYKNKPDVFELNKNDIIAFKFKDSAFISALLLNNKYLKTIFHGKTFEKSVETIYPHMIWYSLMFMKYPFLKGYILNKIITIQEYNKKLTIENMILGAKSFQQVKDLVSSRASSKQYNCLFTNRIVDDAYSILSSMIMLKAFNHFNYNSVKNIIKLFFNCFPISIAILYSFCFTFLLIMPATVIKKMLKFLFKIKNPKDYPINWFSATYAYECGGNIKKLYTAI